MHSEELSSEEKELALQRLQGDASRRAQVADPLQDLQEGRRVGKARRGQMVRVS